jgi:hypothetical protein
VTHAQRARKEADAEEAEDEEANSFLAFDAYGREAVLNAYKQSTDDQTRTALRMNPLCMLLLPLAVSPVSCS